MACPAPSARPVTAAVLVPVPHDPVVLVPPAARGDRAALAALARWAEPVVAAHARQVLRRLAPSPGRDDLVEEVCAEVQAFLATGADASPGPGWQHFELERAVGGLEAWLFGIVRNKARRRLRDGRRGGAVAARLAAEASGDAREAFRAQSATTSPERGLDARRAARLLDALPPRERAALALWMEDAPSREIAARLRFASPHAVECVLSRGRQRLRRMLEGEVEGPARAAA